MTKVDGTALSAWPLKVSSVGVEGARAGRVVARCRVASTKPAAPRSVAMVVTWWTLGDYDGG